MTFIVSILRLLFHAYGWFQIEYFKSCNHLALLNWILKNHWLKHLKFLVKWGWIVVFKLYPYGVISRFGPVFRRIQSSLALILRKWKRRRVWRGEDEEGSRINSWRLSLRVRASNRTNVHRIGCCPALVGACIHVRMYVWVPFNRSSNRNSCTSSYKKKDSAKEMTGDERRPVPFHKQAFGKTWIQTKSTDLNSPCCNMHG